MATLRSLHCCCGFFLNCNQSHQFITLSICQSICDWEYLNGWHDFYGADKRHIWPNVTLTRASCNRANGQRRRKPPRNQRSLDLDDFDFSARLIIPIQTHRIITNVYAKNSHLPRTHTEGIRDKLEFWKEVVNVMNQERQSRVETKNRR